MAISSVSVCVAGGRSLAIAANTQASLPVQAAGPGSETWLTGRSCLTSITPKSRAGVRVVDFPELIVPDVRKHLDWLPSATALVFASSTGSPLAHSNFRRRVWLPALAAVGLEGIHLHDLRHTGNELTANAGANPKELMARMGHDSERAALIYLHSSDKRQRALADAVAEAGQRPRSPISVSTSRSSFLSVRSLAPTH
jgi:Phage integrase family